MKYILLGLSFVVGLLIADSVQACKYGRCYSCRSRVYYRTKYVDRPVYIPQAPIIFNNNAPPTLVQGGTSAFGYGNDYSFGAFNPLDLNLVANLEARIATQAQDNLAALTSAASSAEAMAAIENITKAAVLQEMTQMIRAADLSSTSLPQSTSTSLRLEFRDGQWRVIRDNGNGNGNGVGGGGYGNGGGGTGNGGGGNGGGTSYITQYCGSCHGGQLTEPKGELFLTPETITPEIALKALDQIAKGNMPPEGSPQPDAEGKAGILSELLSITQGN